MFIDLNDLKGIIVDLDSFDESTDNTWAELQQDIKVLFFSSQSNCRLDKLIKLNSRFIKYNGTPIGFLIDKNVLVEMLNLMGLQSYEVVFLSRNYENLTRIQELPISTIYMSDTYEISYDKVGKLCDFQVVRIDDINSIINKKILGYFSEIASIIYDWGKKLSFEFAEVIVTEKEYEGYKCTIVCGGRYFNTSDVRYPYHQLSQRITRNKKRETNEDEVFYYIYLDLLNYIEENITDIDGITRIPPKPSESSDRFINIIQRICKTKNKYENLSDSLICVKDYKSQKGLNSLERFENIKGVFKSDSSVKNKHIVVIDDVISTGATAFEAAKTLYENGASNVTILVLAVNQLINNIRRHNYVPLTCDCGREFKMKFNKKNSSAFFSCSGFQNGECKNTLSYFEGIRKHNINNAVKAETESTNIDDCIF